MSDRSPLTDVEKGIISKVSGASFPPATASKRFIRDLSDGHVKQLSPKGRKFLAYIVHRFRRQYTLTFRETVWMIYHFAAQDKGDDIQGDEGSSIDAGRTMEAVSSGGSERQLHFLF